MIQKIAIGRVIHAVIKDARGELVTRPAIITRTWGPQATAVQATVFPDAVNDGLGNSVGKSSLEFDDTGITENTWHWPVRELPKLSAPVDWNALHSLALALCYSIEKLPASRESTDLSLQASELRGAIVKASIA